MTAADFTIEVDARQMQLIADGLALAYVDQRTWRDRCAEAAKRTDKNESWVKTSRLQRDAAEREMAEIETLAAALPEFGRKAYVNALTFRNEQATA